MSVKSPQCLLEFGSWHSGCEACVSNHSVLHLGCQLWSAHTILCAVLEEARVGRREEGRQLLSFMGPNVHLLANLARGFPGP